MEAGITLVRLILVSLLPAQCVISMSRNAKPSIIRLVVVLTFFHIFFHEDAPPEDHNLNYYQEYCRLFIANVVLTTQMKELVNEKNDLLTKLAQLEVKTSQLSGSNSAFDQADDKKKRFRRTASEIDRHYRCPVEPCQKSYGSEGSLNQHLKLKHPEYQANTSGHSSQSALKGKGSKTKDEGGESTHQCVSS
eukprot:TRINITY_DN97_c0_g2_i9.p1 TRINITY_DN97_c0_g2~~TRINITY_DN97_c0_g2_i9.p1  ORF type:complete len:192 (-),score=20.58 TRINITY_DN97_c0_g2_i9:227-802(-)